MKTLILAAIAVVAVSIGASTMAMASNPPNPWAGHTQNDNGQG